MDLDNILKQICEQKSFIGTRRFSHYLICELCTHPFYDQPPTQQETKDNDEHWEKYCDHCRIQLIARIKNSLLPEPRKIPRSYLCRYCGKKRNLIGLWCRTCRNASHRREIKYLLTLRVRSSEEKELLESLKQFPIWNKEFRNVKI